MEIQGKLLLGSGGFNSTPQTSLFLTEQVDQFLGSSIQHVLVVPYASDLSEYSQIDSRIKKRDLLKGRGFIRIDEATHPEKAVLEAQTILILGGNTFRLLKLLYQNNLINVIRDRVLNGMPYMGISAGTNVACPTMMTTNDMPIVCPPSFAALNLVPFQINPHYISGPIFSKLSENHFEKYAGETRDDRILEYHQENDSDVIGLPEATFLKIEKAQVTYLNDGSLTGNSKPARLFRRGQPIEDIPPQTILKTLKKPVSETK